MWEPFRKSLEQWAPQCKIIHDKFHVLQHANDAVDESAAGRVLPARAKETTNSSKGRNGCC
jgi:transposase